MKTFVIKICMEEYGHLVLLAMFDCVDDTKLVQKAIIDVRIFTIFRHFNHCDFGYVLNCYFNSGNCNVNFR